MDPKILLLASKELDRLIKQSGRFKNVILDDWRGVMFVFDTVDVRRCKNNCAECPLYRQLKNELPENNGFFTGLYPASTKDQALFGPQRFLNCKTLKQYRDCYVNFLLKSVNGKEEIEDELSLILNCKVLYSSSTDDTEKFGLQFKKDVLEKVLSKTSGEKKDVIQRYLAQHPL